ncbi:isochorismatase hydrolase [Jeotgalibacillus alimentarius]|uniref:Isochorismatase hydrolase n=1 Tax=Jeotgalibacillus alimentarius TaxID=135826 RepID=A0A0C2SCQ8_9BACL|nr:isochorismatase family cysteine hydrolase [Jeotgalibacillus alimentarius]KIL51754.1 isochorismatase hydrolase [Jeotgalibacillus alimentarius]
MTNRALIHIDYTNDFVADNGALTCGEPGQLIENEVVRLTKEFHENKDHIIFAIDLHEENDPHHPETKLFPPHNIRGTEGRNLYGSLQRLYNMIQDDENVIYIDKTRYSAFAGTNLEQLLRERGITELHLIGVCTDICVLHTAVDAYNKGFQLVIHKKATASFNQAGHEWALGHFALSLGAEVR